MRLVATYAIRVKPGASRTRVGGAYGDPPALVVAVTEPAVDGRANEGAARALGEALSLPRGSVEIVSGHTARSKIIRIVDPPPDMQARWTALLEQS